MESKWGGGGLENLTAILLRLAGEALMEFSSVFVLGHSKSITCFSSPLYYSEHPSGRYRKLWSIKYDVTSCLHGFKISC